MKKLLKSILIATASVGAVAGSTAAVVSCGETKNTVDSELKGFTAFWNSDQGPSKFPLHPASSFTADVIKRSVAGVINGIYKVIPMDLFADMTPDPSIPSGFSGDEITITAGTVGAAGVITLTVTFKEKADPTKTHAVVGLTITLAA